MSFIGIFKPHSDITVVGAPKDWRDLNRVAPTMRDQGWLGTTAYNVANMFSADSVPNGLLWRLLSSHARESYYSVARTAGEWALLAKQYQRAFTYYTNKVRGAWVGRGGAVVAALCGWSPWSAGCKVRLLPD